MNKKEFIEKLKGHGAWCTECHDINGEKDRYVKVAKVRELLEQLDEPQAEKVEVPDFVADWFEGNKWDLEGNIFIITVDICNEGARTDFEKWFDDASNKPIETLIKMKLFGYTVEQPKRWVVKHKDDCIYFEKFDEDKYDFSAIWTYLAEPPAFKFTDRAKAEAVATLVEGSVEEV